MRSSAPDKLTIVNPANGRTLTTLRADDASTVHAKYTAARRAQTAWTKVPLAKKLAVMKKFRDAVIADRDELAFILTSEMGKPIAQARNELNALTGRIDFFLTETRRTLKPKQVFSDGVMKEVISHEPLGVIANISAWNYPYFVGANVFVPALLTGNAVLYKPSEFATLTGLAIARYLHTAGVPDDVFIASVGGGATGAALLKQSIDGVFFTGSYATGKRIAHVVAGRMIKLQLELGGKDPIYVADDADPAEVAAGIADGAFYNTGQSCCSVERVYVHETIHASFVDAFVKAVQTYRVGDPVRDDTYIGPLTRAAQIKVLAGQVADARKKGAKVLAGGKRIAGKGNWFEPTVLVNVDHSMAVMREESFGPIIGIMAVKDDADALAKMNDTEYGLTAGVYTRDERRARKLLGELRAGSVYWNCCDRVSPRLPWSGVGHSGVGLTLSKYGIEAFARVKGYHLRAP